MAKTTSNKKTEKPERDAFRVESNEVVITRQGDLETLQIDGQIVEFYHTVAGYRLKTDAFRKPQKTLRDAVTLYLKERAKR